MIYEMDKDPIRSEWVGRVVDGRFTLLRSLGGSERGYVFLTELRGQGSQKAAIKIIPADAMGAEALYATWSATTSLSHPHLMHLLHTGRCEIDAIPYIYVVLEYADENLAEILLERPLTPTETRDMLGPVLDALSYIHANGLVHGQLKPSNIMVVDDQLRISSDSLHAPSAFGRRSPAPGIHDAPEGATGIISPAADIWSLGVTLVEALTQDPPAWDEFAKGEPIVPASVPEPFAEIAKKCLQVDPQSRCTIDEIRACLEPPQSVPEATPPIKTQKKAETGRFRVIAVIATLAALLAIVAVLELRSHRIEPAPPTGETASTDTAPQAQAPAPEAAGPATAPETQAPTPEATSPTTPPENQAPAPEAASSTGTAVKGAVTERVMPEIPEKAIQTIRGQFQLAIRANVDSNGTVSNAELDSPGPSRYFANLALQAVQRWKFRPAQVDGRAAPSVWVLTFQFSQVATEVTPVEVAP
jgi:TonB family protein